MTANWLTWRLQLVSSTSVLIIASASAATDGAEALQPDKSWLVEITFNGEDTGIVSELRTNAQGCPVVDMSVLRDAGLLIEGEGGVCLTSAPGVDYRFSEKELLLNLYALDRIETLDPEPQRIESRALSPQISALVVDYGLTVQHVDGQQGADTAGFADLSGTVTSALGTIRHSVVASSDGDDTSLIRLESVYEKELRDQTATVTLGDAFIKAPRWGRTSSFAGVQYGTDFSLRPTELQRPYKTFQTLLKEQSEIEVVVNGVSQGTRPVGPGIEDIAPNQVDGLNQVQIQIRDALGFERVEELSFVSSQTALAKGKTEHNVAVGVPRKFDGLKNTYEDRVVASGMVRHGLNDSVTVEAYTELSDAVKLLGSGAVVTVGTLGTANLSVSASESDATGRGHMASVGFERRTARSSLSVQARFADEDFSDTLAVSGVAFPDTSIRANAGISTDYGAFRIGYNVQRDKLLDNRNFVTANWSRPIGRRASVFATGFSDLERDETGVTVGLRVPLGGTLVRSSVDNSRGRQRADITVERARGPGDAVQWRAALGEGDGPTTLRADANIAAPLADIYAGIGRTDTVTDLTGSVRGGLVVVKGKPQLTRETGRAFAVVDLGGLADTIVYQENRPIGRTDENGQIIVTQLQPYQANRISVQPNDIPIDFRLASPMIEIFPASGATEATFDISADQSVSFVILDEEGQPLMPGAVAYNERTGARSLVGYGGKVFFADAEDSDSIKIISKNGTFYTTAGYVRVKGILRLAPTQEAENVYRKLPARSMSTALVGF